MELPDANFVLRVEGVYVGVEAVVSMPRTTIMLTLQGIKGDRHYGHSKRAGVREQKFHEKGTEIFNARTWSAVSTDELREIALKMDLPEVKAEWLGANLLLSGCYPLTLLPPLTRLVFPSGATLLVYAENLPCKFPAEAMVEQDPSISPEKAKLFAKAAMHKRGLVGWVEREGSISVGDLVEVHINKAP